MDKMQLVFVENEPAEIASVVTVLETSKYFDIVSYKDFSFVNTERIAKGDLFVLDVLTPDGDGPFCNFIGVLQSHQKPFIAFTRMSEHNALRSMAGVPHLRKAVFENGGLGMVAKFAPAGEESRISRKDLELDLVERIMAFHWAWRTARSR